MADQGQCGCLQWNQTCSLQTLVCSLAAGEPKATVCGGKYEDSHTPGWGMLVMMKQQNGCFKDYSLYIWGKHHNIHQMHKFCIQQGRPYTAVTLFRYGGRQW